MNSFEYRTFKYRTISYDISPYLSDKVENILNMIIANDPLPVSATISTYSFSNGKLVINTYFEVANKIIDTSTSKNIDCPITYEPIKYGHAYLNCSTCKYNFSEKAIARYFTNYNNKSCPLCRSKWSDFCNYVNKDEHREKLLQNTIRIKRINDALENETKILEQNNKGKLNQFMNGYTKHNKKWHYGK